MGYKTVSVEVDVDLDDIDLDDMVEELADRVEEYQSSGRNKRDMEDLIQYSDGDIRTIVKFFGAKLKISEGLAEETLADHFLNQYIEELKSKYTETQLREMERIYVEGKEDTNA